MKIHTCYQSELPRPIPWNCVESDLGSTSRNYLINVALTLYNVTLTSQKPCRQIRSVVAAKQIIIREVYVFFFNKILFSDIFEIS